MIIEIDDSSGFCFGVTAAIERAEEQMAGGDKLYCLGDIVHNSLEVKRLEGRGLRVIDHEAFAALHDAKVLLRAHGEPPQTYATAKRNNIDIIDATCPVVLALQRRIRHQHEQHPGAQIVIFGKKGHAEVLGLVGQVATGNAPETSSETAPEASQATKENLPSGEGTCIVVESVADLAQLDFSRDIYLYSQTTKSLADYEEIIAFCRKHITGGATFRSFDTICRRVANRIDDIRRFAESHDVVLFVSGQKSSNGRVLFEQCRAVNERCYMVESPEDIRAEWLVGESVGICGATSTPKWLMEECLVKTQAIIIK